MGSQQSVMVSLAHVRVIPPLPTTERGSACHIATDKEGERVLYCTSNNVLWRSVPRLVEGQANETVEDVFTYRGHAKKTTCVEMSPNGNWVLSSDTVGTLRLWGAKGDNVLKNEYRLWNGSISQVGWSADSTRIVACGDGKETKAAAMIWDTGSKTGDVGGHTKAVNSISFRSQRPFRVATCSEDMSVIFHAGPPFKNEKTHNNLHTNFVNCVRYSPDGEWCMSGGADGKVCLFEGRSGELVREFEKPNGMTGSIWSAAWSPDSARIVTAGGDKKIRFWDRDSGTQLSETLVGEGSLGDMQLGVCWPTAERVISVCLDGRILFWDVTAEGGPSVAAAVDGTQGPLNSVACDPTSGAVVSGGAEGAIMVAPPGAAPQRAIIGSGVTRLLAHSPGGDFPAEVVLTALDDKLRFISPTTGEVLSEPIAIGEFVTGVSWFDAAETKLIVVTSRRSFMCVQGGSVAWTLADACPRRPTAMAASAAGTDEGSPVKLAVAMEKSDGFVAGAAKNDFNIAFYTVADPDSQDSLSQVAELTGHVAEVQAIQFSPGAGEMLASADAGNKVLVWRVEAGSAQLVQSLMSHTARVTCLAWLPEATHLVSGSLDQSITVWKVEGWKKAQAKEAHRLGVTSIALCGENVFASVGQDGYLNMYQVS